MTDIGGLGQALSVALGGTGTPPMGRDTFGSTADAIRQVSNHLGTTPPAGISGRTWRRLRHDPDRRMTPRIANALREAQRAVRLDTRRARLSPDRERRLRQPYPGITISSDMTVSNETRNSRTIRITRSWPDPQPGAPGPRISTVMNPVIDRWLAGDDMGAAHVLVDAIEECLGQEISLDGDIGVAFG